MEEQKEIRFAFTKKGFVRLVSFAAALVLVLGAGTAVGNYRAGRYRLRLEEHYSQTLTGLASNLTGISATMEKGMYASTPLQISLISARLWKDASAAKTALEALPVGELHLDNTTKFLSQVGDYAMCLSRKAVAGTEISDEEKEQFARLCEYGAGLAGQVYNLEQGVIGGAVTMEQIERDIQALSADNGAQPQARGTVGAFQELEDAFSDYPDLVYDGPFSDHILDRSPRMLEGAADVSFDEARKRAAQAAEVPITMLRGGADEESTLPAYTLEGEGCWVTVTKKGGFLTSMMKSRMPGEAMLTCEEAKQKAEEYLRLVGRESMTPTYFESSGGVCTINFAYRQGDVVVYPDLVKVSVALDNGEILGYDARGFLTNHYNRTLRTPKLTMAEAGRIVANDRLELGEGRLVIIPTDGLGEVLCYEFTATDRETGGRVLVYLNADTGAEENILLLSESETGVVVR